MTTEITFPLISGNISLDLVNTEVVSHGTRHDLLISREHVLAWFNTINKEGNLSRDQFNGNIELWADDALPLLREIRSFLREGYERRADGIDLSCDWNKDLELYIKQAPFMYKLKDNQLVPIPIGKPADALLSIVALDALKLLSSNQLSKIQRCANPECVLLFIDTHGRRKWCSMQICGNRSKVTRHQRQKSAKEK